MLSNTRPSCDGIIKFFNLYGQVNHNACSKSNERQNIVVHIFNLRYCAIYDFVAVELVHLRGETGRKICITYPHSVHSINKSGQFFCVFDLFQRKIIIQNFVQVLRFHAVTNPADIICSGKCIIHELSDFIQNIFAKSASENLVSISAQSVENTIFSG